MSTENNENIPANFEISSFTITPTNSFEGQPVIISVKIQNTGDLEGTYTVEIKVDGVSRKIENLTLSGNETQTVTLTVVENLGTHIVEVNGNQQTFTVLKPSAFEFSNLDINPSQALPGELVTISVTVKNTGDTSGSKLITLEIDDSKISSENVLLASQENRTVTFTVIKYEVKSYSVKIENLSGYFQVVQPLQVTESRIIRSSGRYDYVVGFVKNVSNQTLEVDEITAVLRDAQGNLVQTATSYSHLDVLRPNEKTPFKISFEEDDTIVQADVQASWDDVWRDWYFDLQITESTLSGDDVYGIVKNTGSQTAQFVKVFGAFYDTNGNIIWTDYSYSNPYELTPGAQGTFELNGATYGGTIASYELWIEATT